MNARRSDLFSVFAAYTAWGLLPLYWKELSHVPPEIILLARVAASAVFLGGLLFIRGSLCETLARLREGACFFKTLPAAFFISVNWLVFVYAMGHHRIVESGLGYFICPMLVACFGALLFGETVRGRRAVGLAIVFAGVALKVVLAGSLPWIALSLAISFACYIAVRKRFPSDPVQALFQEVVVSLPVIVAAVCLMASKTAPHTYDPHTVALLFISGPITALPLLWLARGLRTVPLQTSAVMQYVAPTLTLLIGISVGEQVGKSDVFSLCFIWIGIAVFLSANRGKAAGCAREPEPVRKLHVPKKLAGELALSFFE